MTLLQMKAIILTVELGSMSLAARSLNISQSNVSAYIKDVEEELGVQLLVRSRKGIVATEQGTQFLEHAKRIIIEQESILNINKLQEFYRLRVGSMHFSIARNIFNKLCIKYSNTENIDMLYTNVSILKGIDMLNKRQIDIVVGFIRSDLLTKAEWLIKSNNIEKKELGIMKAFIRLRKDHPLVSNGINKDGTINISLLKNYPYIDYEAFKEEDSDLINNFVESGIHQIYISDEKSRYEIMSKSDVYSMGRKLSKEIEDQYGLVSIPIKDMQAQYCILTRKKEMTNPILQEFVDMLDEEKKTLNSNPRF